MQKFKLFNALFFEMILFLGGCAESGKSVNIQQETPRITSTQEVTFDDREKIYNSGSVTVPIDSGSNVSLPNLDFVTSSQGFNHFNPVRNAIASSNPIIRQREITITSR